MLKKIINAVFAELEKCPETTKYINNIRFYLNDLDQRLENIQNTIKESQAIMPRLTKMQELCNEHAFCNKKEFSNKVQIGNKIFEIKQLEDAIIQLEKLINELSLKQLNIESLITSFPDNVIQNYKTSNSLKDYNTSEGVVSVGVNCNEQHKVTSEQCDQLTQ